MGVIKTLIIALILSIGFIAPLYSTELSEAPLLKEEPLTFSFTEDELRQYLEDAISTAVNEAVAVAIKEERTKVIDLETSIKIKDIDTDVIKTEFENFKKDNLKTLFIFTTVGFAVGIITGGIITYFVLH
jgi:hypothetical protein